MKYNFQMPYVEDTLEDLNSPKKEEVKIVPQPIPKHYQKVGVYWNQSIWSSYSLIWLQSNVNYFRWMVVIINNHPMIVQNLKTWTSLDYQGLKRRCLIPTATPCFRYYSYFWWYVFMILGLNIFLLIYIKVYESSIEVMYSMYVLF